MARIRSVHPSLFTDEAWVSCGPLARILYIGLWTDADDQGLFEWKPLQIKMRLLPGDAADVSALLAELEGVNLIQGYESGGKRFGAIANFRKFQRPQKPNAIHPLPENIAEYVCLSATATEPVSDHSATTPVIAPQMEDGGWRMEATTVTNVPVVSAPKKKPKPAKASPSKRCPDDWSPSVADIAVGEGEGLSPGEIERALAKMRDFEFKTPHVDWSATFRNWLRDDAARKPKNANDARFDARHENYRASHAGSQLAVEVLAARGNF